MLSYCTASTNRKASCATFQTPTPPPLEKVQRFLAGQQAHWEKYGYGNWGILPEGEKEIVGWAGLQFLPELNETEVGFLLDRPFWGKGYATEAALASLNFGFEQFQPGSHHRPGPPR